MADKYLKTRPKKHYREIIRKKTAPKLDYSDEVIMKAIMAQTDFTARIMERGEFEPILLPSLGTFSVKPKRLKKINERNYERIKSVLGGKRKSSGKSSS